MTSSPPLLAPLLPASRLVLAALDISAAYHNYLDGPTTCGMSPLNSRQNESCVEAARSAPYIVNGYEAEYGQWPFLAWVSVNRSDCSGVIVSREVVITAGHCADRLEFERLGKATEEDPETPAFVKVGKISRFEKDTFEARYEIKTVQFGAYYQTRGFSEPNQDFARVWLRTPIEFNDYVQPVCIPSTPEMVYRLIAGPLFFVGNGMKYEHLEQPVWNNKTQWLQMKTSDPQFEALPMNKDENLTLFDFIPHERNDQKICFGDSGGPLVAFDENKRWSLVGIAIRSRRVCQPGYGYFKTDTFVLMAKIVGIFDKKFKPKPNDYLEERFINFRSLY